MTARRTVEMPATTMSGMACMMLCRFEANFSGVSSAAVTCSLSALTIATCPSFTLDLRSAMSMALHGATAQSATWLIHITGACVARVCLCRRKALWELPPAERW